MPSYYGNVRHDVIDLIPKQAFGAALEIGGGDFGTLVSVMESSGCVGWGVDIRESGAPIDRMIVGSITSGEVRRQLRTDFFDLVIANDVLEHIVDTAEFVNTIFDVLRSGGYVALSVPNVRQIRTAYHIFIRGRFPRDDAGLFDRTHVRWFCKSDVIEALSTAGFVLEQWQPVGRFVPPILNRTIISELLALQNIFIFKKP